MPCCLRVVIRTRFYTNIPFLRPEDSKIEVENMKPGVGKMIPFPSIWGHWAGGPGESKEDVKWLDDKLRDWLAM